MMAIGTLLCIVVMLGYHLTLGTPVAVTIQAVKVICSDENFIKDLDVKIMTDGQKTIINSKYEIVKEIPQDALCAIEFFKKEGNEYQNVPLPFPPQNCCKLVFDNEQYKKVMENQSVPKSCPIKEGKYNLSKFSVPDDMLSDDADRGEYRTQFKMTLQSGSCVYGQETDWKISDKE